MWAEVLVGQVGESATVGSTAGLELLRWDQCDRGDGGGNQKAAHNERGGQ